MRPADLVRTAAFRWSLAIAGAFAALSLVLFAFVYWQTAGYERAELDEALRHEGHLIAAGPPTAVGLRLETWLAEDLHHVRYVALLDTDGRLVFGNLLGKPADVPIDGQPYFTPAEVVARGREGDSRHETLRAAAFPLPDKRLVVLGLDLDELNHTQAVILRALGLGLLPMLLLGLGGGAWLGQRALDRVAAVDLAIERVMRGDLGERLPVRGTGDEFDRLARGVNIMLDDLERLLEEVRGVGNSVAHDLKTPLTRARLRLERSRDGIRDADAFRLAIDEALVWLDQTFAVITAILRIGEIEHGRRRAGFARVALAPLLREVAELYEPLAEEKGVDLSVSAVAEGAATVGDRALIFEALANLVDNAVKFSPTGETCSLGLTVERGMAVLGVRDRGPGIPEDERPMVVRRFYRGEASRSSEGSGLGLPLVSAVARLHGFSFTLDGADPGCLAVIRCPLAPPPGVGEAGATARPPGSADADHDAGGAHEPAAEHPFGGGRDRRRVHEAPPDPGDDGGFERHDRGRRRRGGGEVGDQVGDRVADAAGDRHQAVDEPA